MSVTLHLPPDVENRLRVRAVGSGLGFSEYVVEKLLKFAEEEPDVPSVQSLDLVEEGSPWRGVFTVDPIREELFPNGIQLTVKDFPLWQPEIILDLSRYSDAED